MSQKSSVPQVAKSVSQALMPDTATPPQNDYKNPRKMGFVALLRLLRFQRLAGGGSGDHAAGGNRTAHAPDRKGARG
jgi:hypothetical protein